MSRPWSPAEVEERAFKLRRELDDMVLALPRLVEESAKAKREYRSAKAQAYLAARARNPSLTVDERKAMVDDEIGDVEAADMIAEEMLRAARDRIRVGLAEQDMLRSMLVSHRQVVD